jgi:Post-segregation antitoxin CcdA
MGNKVTRPRRTAGISTSVRLDIDLYLAAQRKGTNISEVTNRALRALFKVEEEDMTDAQVAQLLAERAKRVENVVISKAMEEKQALETALSDLQVGWNLYRSSSPDAPRDAQLSWVEGRKAKNPALAILTNEAILSELEGK